MPALNPPGESRARASLLVLPARGGSKRIARKNIIPFCGAPLFTHGLREAASSGLFATIHVSTEDAGIAAVAAAHGYAPEFLRDAALADDHTPLLPVLRFALARFATMGMAFDDVTVLMPTAPLITADDLIAAHALFARHGAALPVLAVARLPVPVEWAMRKGEDGTLSLIQPGMDQMRSQDLAPAWYDAGAFAIYPAATLVADAAMPAWVGHEVPRWRAVDIDTQDDLDLAEKLFMATRQPGTGAE